jgi:shikimate dehydrogenase
MQEFGLIGYPLSHSFSKKFFTEKFAKEEINAAYELYPLTAIEEVSQLVNTKKDLHGLNVTIPYKKQVIQYLAESSAEVKEMLACNCIKIVDGKMIGYNTDVVGFEKSLVKQLKPYHNKALILGTGGAAAAVEFVLRKLKIEYLFVSRNKDHNAKAITYNEVSETLLSEHLLIINTTPLGMYPKVDECPDLPYQYLSSKHYLYDLVYNPAETLFLIKGKERGAIIKNGEEMLILQAEESWRIWNE